MRKAHYLDRSLSPLQKMHLSHTVLKKCQSTSKVPELFLSIPQIRIEKCQGLLPSIPWATWLIKIIFI